MPYCCAHTASCSCRPVPTHRAKCLPPVHPRPPAAGMQEHQLKELAYAIFLSCAGSQASPGLLASLRAQLELNEGRAAELQRITTLVGQQGVTSLASLQMHIKLLQVGVQAGVGLECACRECLRRTAGWHCMSGAELRGAATMSPPSMPPPRPFHRLQIVRPSAFDSFRNFVRWRDTVTSVVWLVLSQAARDSWLAAPAAARSSPGLAAVEAAVAGSSAASAEASARTLLAR